MAKTFRDPRRAYRMEPAPVQGEARFQVVVEETDLWVVAEKDLHREVEALVRTLRGQIKTHITLQPEFLTSLVPVAVRPGAPEIVRRMAEAAEVCGVGPMAAVAGTMAELVARAFEDRTPNILVENGGDCFLCSTRERVVGLLPDPEAGVSVGLRFAPEEFPLSLCASSGRIGHSLSFGHGDLVVVRSPSGALADAAATALSNRLKSSRDLEQVVDGAKRLEAAGVQGVFAQCGGKLAVWGRMELAALGG
jgi:ApbE superfamily uncharacterized protein (UPF0280 family)